MPKAFYLAENFGSFSAPDLNARMLMHSSGHNIGNLVFWDVTHKLLDVDFTRIPYGAKDLERFGSTDLFVIPAANFLNDTAELGWLADLIEEVDKPVLVVGLGAQSEREDQFPQLRDGTVRFLQAAAQRTPFLALRGAYSQRLCVEHGVTNVRVMGCPSLFTNADRSLAARTSARWDRPIEKVAVHAASIKGQVIRAERLLFGLLEDVPGSSYVVQRPVELIKLILGLETSEGDETYLTKVREFLAPHLTPDDFASLVRRTGMVPYSVDSWKFALRAYSHSLGTRFHGAMTSIAAGLPTICITHDTRTRELCDVMKVPSIAADLIGPETSVEEIFAAVSIDADDFEDNRSTLAKSYDELIRASGFEPSPYFARGFL